MTKSISKAQQELSSRITGLKTEVIKAAKRGSEVVEGARADVACVTTIINSQKRQL